ncbi:hypothetical protein Nepgr_001152 [Nepenthes gracilis]|uniref:RNA methyltransferase At5g10620 n=1 Tax=Nepenthes gracilis TaxID=150966 RepID=A0AAD3RXC6_NEPGR|nr:hypothetical protein Nepgr_001152 [Nepenthes gracilis]
MATLILKPSGTRNVIDAIPRHLSPVARSLMVISLSACFHHNNSSPLGGRCKYTGQSVRALPIRITTVGKKRSHGVQLVVDEYSEKLKYYSSVDCLRIRSNPKNAHDVKAQIEDEDLSVMCVIRSDDWVVILDEGGCDMSSELLAELIGDAGMTGASRLVFCIGGPYGHGRLLRKRANKSLKLSSLTLNHQIALVVLMEQLYRLCFEREAYFSREEGKCHLKSTRHEESMACSKHQTKGIKQ